LWSGAPLRIPTFSRRDDIGEMHQQLIELKNDPAVSTSLGPVYVFGEQAVDRRYHELCAMEEYDYKRAAQDAERPPLLIDVPKLFIDLHPPLSGRDA